LPEDRSIQLFTLAGKAAIYIQEESIMRARFIMSFLVSVLVVASASSPVLAADSFSITPPPIVAPAFEAGKTEGKARFTYFSMEGNGMELTGGGVDMIGRKAFSDELAGDLQGGLFVFGGDISTGLGGEQSTTYMNLLLGGNGEFQALKGDRLSTLLFAGPSMTILLGSYEYTYLCGFTTTCTDTATLSGYLFGLQAGIQFGINAGDLSIDPFAMVMTQSGSMTTSTSFDSTSVTIDAFTTTSFGVDITY